MAQCLPSVFVEMAGATDQMSRAYSAIVRSAENLPALAVLSTALLNHLSLSYNVITPWELSGNKKSHKISHHKCSTHSFLALDIGVEVGEDTEEIVVNDRIDETGEQRWIFRREDATPKQCGRNNRQLYALKPTTAKPKSKS